MNTDYPLTVSRQVEEIAEQYDESEYLHKYQYIVKEYLINSPNRGILIYHSPGMGKTITAVEIAEYYRKQDPRRKIVVLLSKSLENNFKQSIASYAKRHGDAPGHTISK